MKCEYREESDILTRQRNERGYARSSTELLVDRLASDLGVASYSSCLLQPPTSLGVHVDSVVRHLSQPEVADMVEGTIANCSFSMALCSLSFRLAGNGRRSFLGCDSARFAASALDMAVGYLRNDIWGDSALDSGTVRSTARAPFARMGGDAGSDPAVALRHFPNH